MASSDEEKKTVLAVGDDALLRDALVACLLRLSSDLEKSDSGKKEAQKPRWRVFIESAGGAALITVLIGGLVGAKISSYFQKNEKDREFQQTLVKARTDQALTAYKDYIDKREEFVKNTLNLVGNTLTATDNYARLATPEYIPTDQEPVSTREKKKEQYILLNNEYNASDNNWRIPQNTINSQLNDFFQDQPELAQTFIGVEEALNAYKRCVEALVGGSKTPCNEQKLAVNESIKSFNISQVHHHIWDELVDPKAIRKFLQEISDTGN